MSIGKIDKWQFSFDDKITKLAYAQIEEYSSFQCDCNTCRNFKISREKAYPNQFKTILEYLGICYQKEAEIYFIKKIESNKFLYGGWFHFVGQMIKNDSLPDQMFELTDNFKILFTEKTVLVPPVFKSYPILQLEFNTSIPWVIENKRPN